jgi:DNA-binding response OmpR family regulator
MLRHGALEIDLDRREVRLDGNPINLSDVEFRTLVAVLQGNGRVLTRNRLIEIIYGMDRDVLGRTIDVAVRRIRAKLGDDADSPQYIATVRGVGYRAAARPDGPPT